MRAVVVWAILERLFGLDPSLFEALHFILISLFESHQGCLLLFEPRHEKTGFLHMRKQRRRSVVR